MKLKILILSPVPWGFLWQRPQQIVSRLAREGHRILYLQNPIYLDGSCLDWALKGGNLFLGKKITGQLNVVNIFLPSLRGKLKFVSENLGVRILKLYLSSLGFKPEVAMFYGIEYVFLLDTLKSMGTKILYDCDDEASGFSGVRDIAGILQKEKDLATNSSIVIATSKALYQKISKLNSNCFYIPNGADVTHFLKATKPGEKIPGMEHLRHPVIGYIGAIFDWFDAELVCRLAELHPEYSILLVGPLDYGRELDCGLEKFKQHPNITLLGSRKYEVLPEYLSYMDVCLIPFKINKLTRASNPIKMYEYLAAGKPVVSTALPEICNNASEVVYIGKDREDFIKKVERAVNETKDKAMISRRIDYARDNSWEKRVKTIEALLRNI